MKLLIRLLLVFVVLGLTAAAAYRPIVDYWHKRSQPKWRTLDVVRGDIVSEVTAMGEVKPVESVHIGSFVSGPITEMYVDFNDTVKRDQLLAKVDPRLLIANERRDLANLRTREADVERSKAELQRALNDERRAKELQAKNRNFISQSEMDQFVFNVLGLKAQLAVSEAAVDEAKAALENTRANLGYTEIRSPIDGVVIDKKMTSGQTLAAAFQTPELFVLSPDLEKKIHIFASVDEADIGLILQAQQTGQLVQFTVDAWPADVFSGTIEQIRVSSTTTEKVVTYPVVVSAANPGRKLLPGMTANLSFAIERRINVIKIPNPALRFYPERRYVREADRHLLGEEDEDESEDHKRDAGRIEVAGRLSTEIRVESHKRQERRHVWVSDGNFLRAIEVRTGLSDHQHTELIGDSLPPDQKLVTGISVHEDR